MTKMLLQASSSLPSKAQKKKPEIPITEPKKLGSVGREKFFFLEIFFISILWTLRNFKN